MSATLDSVSERSSMLDKEDVIFNKELEKDKNLKSNIFTPRTAFKPFEYDVTRFKDAINHSYWLVSEFNFTSDIQDFKVRLNDKEKNIVKNTLLAISQIEVAVKKFWTKLGERFPKAEFEQVGVTFGESEVRHADAYSHLLQVLGLNDEFDNILDIPAIKHRVSELGKCLSEANSVSDKKYIFTLTLFSIFIENVSLFSQFVVIKSFNKYKNYLKEIDNVVQATQKEELVHALFGIQLINFIKNENPEWFDEEFYEKVKYACVVSYGAECEVVDWIFEKGDLDFIGKDVLKEFIKDRLNKSLEMIGTNPIFDIDQEKLSELRWFDEEVLSEVNTDFFYKRPVTYSKKMQSVTSEDLF